MGWARLSVLLAAAGAGSAALADIGPKPSIDVKFIFDKPGVFIRSGVLYECDGPACRTSRPLQALGPQRFDCDAAGCGGEAYGYSEYIWIKVLLSDGRPVRSRPFAKRDFDATYKAHVHGRELQVEPVRP